MFQDLAHQLRAGLYVHQSFFPLIVTDLQARDEQLQARDTELENLKFVSEQVSLNEDASNSHWSNSLHYRMLATKLPSTRDSSINYVLVCFFTRVSLFTCYRN